jgi:glycyl-tRNA synthetase beta chain
MPELLLELFSEEIPARMQARGAEDLVRLVSGALAPLAPSSARAFFGPRRIALAATVAAGVAESRSSERGPRVTAPEQALVGFLRKHAASKADLRQDGDFWVLDRLVAGIDAAALIARELPGVLRRFPWPKSMRWGGSSGFTWVRPLRRILCLLDGAVVRFDLRDGSDDGHGLASADITEGHRFLAPAPFAVRSAAAWQSGLRERRVLADAAERRAVIAEGLRARAEARGLTVVEDAGLLDEVAGLVEWPVPLLGRIDEAFMDLPPEVMQVSMRVNQRYFALHDAAGQAAPWFAFAANIEASDGGATIVAGNERVLRARFADARHFWDLDRKQTLESRVPALDAVTFHANLGSQGDRVRRLARLAAVIAPMVGADVALAERAALLAKADLTTGMVGEFPELQGVMGRYYALHDGEDARVADAIRDHYAPKGPSDAVPADPVSIAVALADKIDLLTAFYVMVEKPTGSRDPYALRRAALGIIRVVRERRLRLDLLELCTESRLGIEGPPDSEESVWDFIKERLEQQLRSEGARFDVFAAVEKSAERDHDLALLLDRIAAVAALLGTDDGANLLAGYRRAANILRIEEKKDGPYVGHVDVNALELPEELALAATLDAVAAEVGRRMDAEDFENAMAALASLRPSLDAFFDHVTVNDPRPEIRRNRLRLLARVRAAMHLAADFSKI